MIKFLATTKVGGGKVVGIVLTHADLDGLRRTGARIHIDGKEMNLDHDIDLYASESDEATMRDVRKAGALPDAVIATFLEHSAEDAHWDGRAVTIRPPGGEKPC